MQIIETKQALSDYLSQLSIEHKDIGFVPTMGALHEGHMSLINQAKAENDVCICSIFINPKQFNNPEDYKNYPKDFNKDVEQLESVGCDVVFHPSYELIYPGDVPEPIDLGILETVMEGQFRPGHFRGVAAVVRRFFELLSPKRAYFGLKDYQQFTVINQMVQALNLDVSIIGCDTIRSENGLALSSRNQLLTENGKQIASVFYNCLQDTRSMYHQNTVTDIKTHVIAQFKDINNCELEYFEIVDAVNLTELTAQSNTSGVVACIAGFVEGIRLIDNLVIIP